MRTDNIKDSVDKFTQRGWTQAETDNQDDLEVFGNGLEHEDDYGLDVDDMKHGFSSYQKSAGRRIFSPVLSR